MRWASWSARLEQPLNEIEERLHELGAVTRQFQMPPPDVIRRRAQVGRRRNTVLLVATALALVVGGGFVVTEGDTLEMRADMPRREKIGAERQDLVLRAQDIGSDDLLTMSQVERLDPERPWKVVDTDDDTTSTTPYATCPTKRFANKDPLRAFVRTYTVGGDKNERVAQAIEVSRSAEQAEEAYRRLVSWYSDCAHPRVQLVDSYVATREFGDFRILRLQSHRSPERTFTVGFTHSGSVTIALVHEVDGDRGPAIDEFVRTLNDSVAQVCKESGGRCTDDIEAVRTDPPRTSVAPAFLGIVDLPPIADIDRVWAAAESPAGGNPAATQCDSTSFGGKEVRATRSRVYVIPGTRELPEEFGVAQTVGRFGSVDAAKAFVKKVEKRVSTCEDDNLSAKVDQKSTVSSGEGRGTAWRVGLELNKKSRVYYRMAIVRSGSDVLQVTFTPAGRYDIDEKTFTALAERATQRLVYLD